MSTTTIQRKKGKKSYEELLQEARDIASKTAAVFIPLMADALREENPDWANHEIKARIANDCYGIWSDATIYKFLPSWLHNEKLVKAQLANWEKRHKAQKTEIERKISSLSKIEFKAPKIRDEEDSDDDYEASDSDLGEPMLESYGDNYQSALTLYGKINEPARDLFKALTNKDLPGVHDDLVMEYLKPSREYRKGIFYEVDQSMRASLYNVLVFTRDALNDTIDLLDRIDEKA